MRLEFNFYKDHTPEKMLSLLKREDFLEVQYYNLSYKLRKDDPVDLISIGIEDKSGYRVEYEEIEIEPTYIPEKVMEEIIKYAEENIVEVMTLMKLR
jgi:hypothetical protein